jgi:hypothetical protein
VTCLLSTAAIGQDVYPIVNRAWKPALCDAPHNAGFHHLYEGGAIYEVACWAHARRKFHDIHVVHASPMQPSREVNIARDLDCILRTVVPVS